MNSDPIPETTENPEKRKIDEVDSLVETPSKISKIEESISTPAPTSTISTPESTESGPRRAGRPKKNIQEDDYSPPGITPSRQGRGSVKKEARPTRETKKGISSGVEDILSQLPEAIHNCYYLLHQVKNHKVAWPFLTPVDAIKLNIPDYYQIVKNPMDLGTIGDLLLKGRYGSADAFKADVLLVFSNCYLYNPQQSDVVKMAQILETWFLEKFKGLGEMVEKRERRPVERLEQTVDLEGNLMTSPQTKKVVKPKTPRTPKVPVIDSREMSHEEKLELSQDITAMDPNKLHGIVGIIQKRAPKASTTTGGQEEIEIDLDKLDPVTLREIEKYVAKNIGKKKKAIARKSRPEAVQQIVQQPVVSEVVSKVTSAPEKESSDSETESSDSDAEIKKPISTVEGGPKPLTQGN